MHQKEEKVSFVEIEAIKISHRLLALRERAGLTQAALAARVGLTRPGYARWEEKVPDAVVVLNRLTEALGVSMAQLIQGEHSAPAPGTLEALQQEVEKLKQENARLRGLAGIPSDAPPTPLSNFERMYRVAHVLMAKGPASEVELQAATGFALEDVKRLCLDMNLQQLILPHADGWQLVPEVVVKLASVADMHAMGRDAHAFLTDKILPDFGLPSSSSSIVMTEVRVGGAFPGQKLANALRDTLTRLEDPAGVLVKMLFAFAKS